MIKILEIPNLLMQNVHYTAWKKKKNTLYYNKFLKKLSEAETEELLKKSIRALTELEDWDADHLQETLNKLLTESNKKPAELFSLIRIAVSFAPFSPALNLTLETLGRETSLARLNAVARSI